MLSVRQDIFNPGTGTGTFFWMDCASSWNIHAMDRISPWPDRFLSPLGTLHILSKFPKGEMYFVVMFNDIKQNAYQNIFHRNKIYDISDPWITVVQLTGIIDCKLIVSWIVDFRTRKSCSCGVTTLKESSMKLLHLQLDSRALIFYPFTWLAFPAWASAGCQCHISWPLALLFTALAPLPFIYCLHFISTTLHFWNYFIFLYLNV